MCLTHALTSNLPLSFTPDSAPLGVLSGGWLSSVSTTYWGPSSARIRRISLTVPAGNETSPSCVDTSCSAKRSTVIGPWATVTQPACSE